MFRELGVRDRRARRRDQLLVERELCRRRFGDRRQLRTQQRRAQEVIGDDEPAVGAGRQQPIAAG
jgi:hypothetical protein